ncbi:hypothetical protein [Paractinoplanes lichenicola]|uniref:Uncharacterized protein n=1 Tax=Paractinoplanes lichenicola TaxID=2802976 RepID=A0ABS1W476_9ACTN|nr:hypothetical protein [Actinoplanes lichenicola]MBL7261363.1 hypothetical protein [Actinoplanes lichenicola]
MALGIVIGLIMSRAVSLDMVKSKLALKNLDSLQIWQKIAVTRRIPKAARRFAQDRAALLWVSRMQQREIGAPRNEKMVLPPGESVEVPLMWVTELYTPTSFENLRAGLYRLLRAADIRDIDSKLSSIEACRRGGGYWSNLVWLQSRTSTRFNPQAVRMDLPDGIESIRLEIASVTSSTTALVGSFTFNDDRSRELNAIVSRPPAGAVERKSGRQASYIYADSARVKEVQDWFLQLQNLATKFISSRMPGSLSRLSRSPLPAVTIMVAKDLEPWQERPAGPSTYLEILGLTSLDGYWENSKFPGLRLNDARSTFHFGKPFGRHLMLAVRREALVAMTTNRHSSHLEDADSRARESLHTLDAYLIAGTCIRWAVIEWLSSLEADLAELRDLIDKNAKNRSGRWLEELRVRHIRTSLDGRIVVKELIDRANLRRMKFPMDTDFVKVRPGHEDEGSNLSDAMMTQIEARGKRVVEFEADLGELLSTNADLAMADQNLRLARKVSLLTVASVVVAVLSLLVAVGAIIVTVRPDFIGSGSTLSPGNGSGTK